MLACEEIRRKSESCPPAEPTISAQSKTRIPVARDAKVMTTRSLSFGSSTNQICTTSSTMSIAAQMKTSVSGLFAATASTPSDVRVRVPAQLTGLGKRGRTAAVMMIAMHNVIKLNANAHEIVSAINVGDWEKRVVGCQTGNCRLIGIWICQSRTLSHANNVPPTANIQL